METHLPTGPQQAHSEARAVFRVCLVARHPCLQSWAASVGGTCLRSRGLVLARSPLSGLVALWSLLTPGDQPGVSVPQEPGPGRGLAAALGGVPF